MKPIELVTIIAKWQGVYLPYLLDKKEETKQTAEICALLLLAYCQDAPTREKAQCLDVCESHLVYLKKECLQRMRESKGFKLNVDSIRLHLENNLGLRDWDKVDYSRKTTVRFCGQHSANVLFSSQNRPLYFASTGNKQ
jgi:hypothetical protein